MEFKIDFPTETVPRKGMLPQGNAQKPLISHNASCNTVTSVPTGGRQGVLQGRGHTWGVRRLSGRSSLAESVWRKMRWEGHSRQREQQCRDRSYTEDGAPREVQ